MAFDFDALFEKERYVIINKRKVLIKSLTMEEYLLAEYKANNIDVELVENESDPVKLAHAIASQMKEYLMMVLDLTEEEAGAIDNRKFRAIREYLATLDMKDQGFSDQEIERLKRQNSKNRVDQMIAASQQQVQ